MRNQFISTSQKDRCVQDIAMNNAPLPLAITLMDFDKFMLSVTDTGAALFSPLSDHYEDRQATHPTTDAEFPPKLARNV